MLASPPMTRTHVSTLGLTNHRSCGQAGEACPGDLECPLQTPDRVSKRVALALALLLGALGTGSGCAGGAMAPPTSAEAESSSLAMTSPPARSIFLWKASSSNARASVYLLGSIHMRAANSADLDPTIRAVIDECARLVFEVDPSELTSTAISALILQRGMLPTTSSLEAELGPELHERWRRALQSLGLSSQPFAQMRPWLAAMSLQMAYLQAQGFTAEQGVEQLVMAHAAAAPRATPEVLGLETALEQLQLLSGGSKTSQHAMLQETVNSILEGQMDDLLDRYLDGDAPGFAAKLASQRAQAPALQPFMEELLDGRNRRMASGILALFDRAGQSLVTVGAAHMFGPSGLLALLRAEGIRVEPIAPHTPAPRQTPIGNQGVQQPAP